MQLSHEEEFSQKTNALLCSFVPIRIVKNLEGKLIDQIACGGEFSIVTTHDVDGNGHEVYSFGSNLRGQLGIEEIKHVKDVSKIEKLSNYIVQQEGQ